MLRNIPIQSFRAWHGIRTWEHNTRTETASRTSDHKQQHTENLV